MHASHNVIVEHRFSGKRLTFHHVTPAQAVVTAFERGRGNNSKIPDDQARRHYKFYSGPGLVQCGPWFALS